MGLPNADKAGPFDPTEANRRGFGNPNSGTFGAMGVPAQGGGIYVTGSLEGSPSAAVGLENGDVIVSINGFLVNTQAEFVQAVHNSPDVMNFIVRNVRTGQNQQMSVRLNRPLRANPPGVRAIEQARPVDPMPAPPPPPIPVEKKAENPQPSRK
jgi:C-terminal processing protease CtpA/Prc